MEKLFTVEQQNEHFQQCQQFFMNGQYEEAKQLLQLVIESATQHNDLVTYVSSVIWLNRIYVNCSDFVALSQSLLLVNNYIDEHPNEEECYLHELHTIICNTYFSIGSSDLAYEQLLERLLQTKYNQLAFTVGSNLLLYYVENYENEKSLALQKKLERYFSTLPLSNKVSLAVHQIYEFLVFFINEDFKRCAQIVEALERNDTIIHNPTFSYNVYICKALLEGAYGRMETAKTLLDDNLAMLPSLATVHFELKLWIQLLLKNELKDDVIYYQQLLIDSLQSLYTKEMSAIRQQVVEDKSKHFYEAQIYVDQLTGVKNRNFYETTIAQQTQVKNYTVAVIDIDKFKTINDTYGHTVGDEAIQFIARTLLDSLPNQNIAVVRYGGDEFILLIPSPYEDVKEDLTRIHQTVLSTPFYNQKDALHIPLSISIGVGYTNERYETIQTLFERADTAIYEAKKTRSAIISFTV